MNNHLHNATSETFTQTDFCL